jgi:hypothetical protein
MRIVRSWVALALMAVMALPALAQTVVRHGQSFRDQLYFQPGGGVYWPDSSGVMQAYDANGNVLVFQSNPPVGLAFYQANAMGPASLREGSVMAGTGSGTTPHWGDSTMVIETRGARRIEVWLYAVFDSANANADSALGAVFAILPKAHLSTVADSAGSAWPITLSAQDSVPLGTQLRSVPTAQPWVAAATSANIVNQRLLPGEFAVVYTRSWGAQAGHGVPVWAKFDLCATNGCFSSEYISLRIRSLGHVRQWPQSVYNVLYSLRYTVRLDVKGYYQ